MKHSSTIGTARAAVALGLACGLAFSLAGCATGGAAQRTTHLSAQQCVDIAAIRANAPANRAHNMGELAALEEAGYQPWLRFDPYYPEDLQDAQQRVDGWYRAECPQAQHG